MFLFSLSLSLFAGSNNQRTALRSRARGMRASCVSLRCPAVRTCIPYVVLLNVALVIPTLVWQTRLSSEIIARYKARDELDGRVLALDVPQQVAPSPQVSPPAPPPRPPPPPRVPLPANKAVGCIFLGAVEGSVGDQALSAMAVFARAYQRNVGYHLSAAATQHGAFWLTGFLAPLLHLQRARHLCHPSTRTIVMARGLPIPHDVDYGSSSVTLTGAITHLADIVDSIAELRSVLLNTTSLAGYKDVVDFDGTTGNATSKLFLAYRPYYAERMPEYQTSHGFYERAIRLALQDGKTQAVYVFSESSSAAPVRGYNITSNLTDASKREHFFRWVNRVVAPIPVIVRHINVSDSANVSMNLALMASRAADLILCNSSLHLVAALLARPTTRVILQGKPGLPAVHIESDIPYHWHVLPPPRELVTQPPPLLDPPCLVGRMASRAKGDPFKGRIILAVTFNGENDILEAHMYELYDLVDYFIVIEANYSHQGEPKPRYFPSFVKERLAGFPIGGKLIYADGSNVNWQECIAKLPPPGIERPERFLCETYLRQSVLAWIPGGIQRDDMFALTDVDMIVNRNVFQVARMCHVHQRLAIDFVLRTSHYSLHFVARDWWFHVYLMPGRLFAEMGNKLDKYLNRDFPSRVVNHDWPTHGYHLSWFGAPETILLKVQTFAESQLNRAPINTLPYIIDHANAGVELLERPGLDMDYRPFADMFAPWFPMANSELRPTFFLYDQPR